MYSQFTPFQPYIPMMPQQVQQQPQQAQMPQIQPNPQPQTQQMQTGDGVFHFVSGMDEVNAWIVQPGRSVFLFDRNKNTFYIKSVDINGMPKPIEICDYQRREEKKMDDTSQKPDFATKEDLEAFKAEILAMIPKKPQTGRKPKQEVEEDE